MRAKAGTDLEDNIAANKLLAHAAMTTTDTYIRNNAGRKADPVMRNFADKPAKVADKG